MTQLIPFLIFLVILAVLYMMQRQQVSFNKRVLTALVVGAVCGFCFQAFWGKAASVMDLTQQAFDLIGNSYLALLKMLVIPLVLTSIMDAMLNLGELSGNVVRQVAVRSVGMLLIMTAIASGIGVLVGQWFSVGQGLLLPGKQILPAHQYHGIVDTLLHMLPSNPVTVMVNGNTIALVIFAVLFGLAALMVLRTEKDKAYSFRQVIASTFHITKKLANMVIALTPYGVVALVAQVTSTQGVGALIAIANYMLAMVVAMLLVFVMHAIVVMSRGVKPWTFWAKAYPALLVAFTTRSSFATLPVSEETLRDRFKTSQITASFVPSMGATMGMNACAGVFPAILVVMAMTILHMPITALVIFKVMLINAIASLGISGIPGTASVAAAVTLSTLGLPYSVIGLVQGVDPIIDMARTATNIDGVMATGVVIDQEAFDAASAASAVDMDTTLA
ncbi:MAG: cation:dicarboxylase symporter family transporter [Coxiellaceae bacterium]|nr:cation:dicarboxylase symporter family transporter [Coxiellaceae bacterium]